MSTRGEVLVVGAGVVGAAMAYYLAKGGAAVTVIERDAPGSRCSKVSFGWINALGKRPEHYHRFSRLGVEAYTGLEEELGPDAGIGGGGSLHWPAPGPEGRAAMATLGKELEELEYPFRLLTARDAAELEPNVRVEGVEDSILYVPMERWVDGDRLARALVGRAGEYRASVLAPCSVREVVARGGRVTGVSTTEGFLPADRVVELGIQVPI